MPAKRSSLVQFHVYYLYHIDLYTNIIIASLYLLPPPGGSEPLSGVRGEGAWDGLNHLSLWHPQVTSGGRLRPFLAAPQKPAAAPAALAAQGAGPSPLPQASEVTALHHRLGVLEPVEA